MGWGAGAGSSRPAQDPGASARCIKVQKVVRAERMAARRAHGAWRRRQNSNFALLVAPGSGSGKFVIRAAAVSSHQKITSPPAEEETTAIKVQSPSYFLIFI